MGGIVQLTCVSVMVSSKMHEAVLSTAEEVERLVPKVVTAIRGQVLSRFALNAPRALQLPP